MAPTEGVKRERATSPPAIAKKDEKDTVAPDTKKGGDAGALQAWQKRALYLVSIVVVADYVGVSMMRVTLPFYAQALGGKGTLVGSIETAYGVGQVIGALTLPRLSDSWGRRAILMLSCAGSAMGYGTAIAARLIGSPALLLASRIPVGLSKQTVTVSRAVVADCTEANEQRSKWMAFLGAALGVGCVVGPFVGGQTAELVGDSAPAFIATSIFIALGPTVGMILPETSKGLGNASKTPAKTNGNTDAPTARAQSLWLDARLVAVLFVLSVGELGLIAHASVTLYTFCMQVLGKGKAWVGNLTSISAIMQAFFSGVALPALTRRGWSDILVLQLGAASFAIGSMAIAYGQTAEAVMFSTVPCALANAVLRAYPATFLSKHVVEERQGEAMGMMDLTSSGIRVVAPILMGMVMDRHGEAAAFVAQAVIFVVQCVGFLILAATASSAPTASASKKAA